MRWIPQVKDGTNQLIITYEGRSYPFDMADVTVKQGMKIEAHMGIPYADWSKALAAGGNLMAIQAFGWLILHDGDLATPIEDCDVKMGRLGEAWTAATAEEAAAEKAAEEAAGPRPTAGTSSGPPEANGTAPPPTLSSAAAS
jgi:hypothetical protein